MKSNWPLVKLEEVADLTVGFVGTMAKHYTQDGVTFLRSTNIEPFNIRFDDIKFISTEFNEKISKSQLRGGDVVIVRTGKPGACTVIPEIEESWNCSDLVIVRPHQEKLDPLYLAAYINLASGTINNQLVGAVQQHFNVASAKKLNIPMPSIDVQKKIAAMVGNLNDKIALNNKINDNLQQQAYAYFLQLFIENADPSWRVGTIADLGTVVGGGTPSKAKPEYYTDDGIAWITPKDLSIDKSKFIAHGENDISELGYRNSSATMMPAGTVLFSSRAPIGYIAIASNEVTTNQGFKSVVPHPEIGTPFVYYFLIHNLPLIESKASGSTFKEVSGSVMKSVEAVIPDGNTIAKFNDFCRPVFEMQEKLEQENRKLAAMRDSLLPRLMSGEIDVADIGI